VQFSGLESVRAAADALIAALQRADRLARRNDREDAALLAALREASAAVDWSAADRGDKPAFIASLTAARRGLP
jgi:hypothetical protein